MAHESRLTRELSALLNAQRVATLGTVGDDGAPFVSMVPYAIEQHLCCLVIHVSGLAAHTRNLQAREPVSLLVMKSEVPGEPVHALPRVTLEGQAKVLERGSPDWQACSDVYITRFPDAEHLTQLGDFMFVAIQVTGARQVAGFGVARSIDAEEVRLALGSKR
jgi:putative heme iron utilization protein